MATKLEQQRAKGIEIAAKHGIAADKVGVYETKRGRPNTITVWLGNGRHISTDLNDGWEKTLEKYIAKFKNKRTTARDGDKAPNATRT